MLKINQTKTPNQNKTKQTKPRTTQNQQPNPLKPDVALWQAKDALVH